MSGHSKWSTIKRKKGASDAQRANVFTKIAREMSVAVKQGGADPTCNSKLRDCIAKAKAANMPNDNIDRCIKKAAGSDDKDNFEELVYEGYGPSGVAVMVETLTDNRNRTAGDLRHYFDKFGGNMGQTGCVAFMFERKGVVVIENEDNEIDEDKAFEICLEIGGDDVVMDDEAFMIYCDASNVGELREALEAMNKYKVLSAQAEYIPSTETAIEDPDLRVKMSRLLDALEENDDVQNVWHNWENQDEK